MCVYVSCFKNINNNNNNNNNNKLYLSFTNSYVNNITFLKINIFKGIT